MLAQRRMLFPLMYVKNICVARIPGSNTHSKKEIKAESSLKKTKRNGAKTHIQYYI